MRIISQDGVTDFPYEQCFVGMSDNNILRKVPLGDNRKWVLARYSTCEKAQRALEMLREFYAQQPVVRDGDFYYLNTVFQFPDDEEVKCET